MSSHVRSSMYISHSSFITLQVVQLQELFDVRHSVFLLGNAGAGKSRVWNSLVRTYKNQGRKPQAIDLDPKAVTNDELFGIINPSTREWKDGINTLYLCISGQNYMKLEHIRWRAIANPHALKEI